MSRAVLWIEGRWRHKIFGFFIFGDVFALFRFLVRFVFVFFVSVLRFLLAQLLEQRIGRTAGHESDAQYGILFGPQLDDHRIDPRSGDGFGNGPQSDDIPQQRIGAFVLPDDQRRVGQ